MDLKVNKNQYDDTLFEFERPKGLVGIELIALSLENYYQKKEQKINYCFFSDLEIGDSFKLNETDSIYIKTKVGDISAYLKT